MKHKINLHQKTFLKKNNTLSLGGVVSQLGVFTLPSVGVKILLHPRLAFFLSIVINPAQLINTARVFKDIGRYSMHIVAICIVPIDEYLVALVFTDAPLIIDGFPVYIIL